MSNRDKALGWDEMPKWEKLLLALAGAVAIWAVVLWS